jgi:hypothetical protein
VTERPAGTKVIDQVDWGVRSVGGVAVRITELVWNGGARSFDVLRVADDADLTEDGSFDAFPTDAQISDLLQAAEPAIDLRSFADEHQVSATLLAACVHDVAAEEAGQANRHGLTAQLQYLTDRLGHGRTLDLLRELADDPE